MGGKAQREDVLTTVRASEQKVADLQQEVARLVQERQMWKGRAANMADPQEVEELKRQRDLLRDAVRKLQLQHQQQQLHQQDDTLLHDKVGELQEQLAAERQLSESLRRRLQREKLGSRLDALDTVGKQIEDLKHVLSGDWSSLSLVNTTATQNVSVAGRGEAGVGNGLEMLSTVRKPQRSSGFASPATPMGGRERSAAASAAAAAAAVESNRKRLEELRAKVNLSSTKK